MHADVNAGIKLAIPLERWQERMDGALIDAERYLAPLEALELLHPLVNFFAQIQHALRILEQQCAGSREGLRPRAADK